MKIAVLTFWNSSDNYGQVLQGYALQKYLKKLGHEPYIVRYEEKKTYPDIFMERGLKAFIKRCIKWLLHHNNYKRQKNAFYKNKLRRFNIFKENIDYSDERYYNYSDLLNRAPKADMYITGSDQVWGRIPTMEKEQPYYLKFGNSATKRIAYAASIGSSGFFYRNPDVLASLTKDFNKISIRESSGLELFKKANIEATPVLDPVFLLSKEDYISLVKKPYNNSIFIYAVNINNGSEINIDELKELAKRKGLTLDATLSSGYFPFNECLGNINYVYPTIEEWIARIYGSELVVTTSFHGIMFCLILHKKFAYIPLKSEYSKGNDRITSVLEMLGLTDRILQTSYNDIIEKEICWEDVDRVIKEKIELSKEFLHSCGC